MLLLLPFMYYLGQSQEEDVKLSLEMRKLRPREVSSTNEQVQGASGWWSGSQITGFRLQAQLDPGKHLPNSRWAQLLLL